MKKDYMKPAMRVVQLKHRNHILAGSPNGYVQGVSNNSEDIYWKNGGFTDEEGDY